MNSNDLNGSIKVDNSYSGLTLHIDEKYLNNSLTIDHINCKEITNLSDDVESLKFKILELSTKLDATNKALESTNNKLRRINWTRRRFR